MTALKMILAVALLPVLAGCADATYGGPDYQSGPAVYGYPGYYGTAMGIGVMDVGVEGRPEGVEGVRLEGAEGVRAGGERR
jgi:hypothetical protein